MRDGVESLHRRTNSRLWYRMPLGAAPAPEESEPQPPAAHPVTTLVHAPFDLMLDSATAADDIALTEVEDEYTYFELDTTGMKLRTLNFKDSQVLQALRGSTNSGQTQAAWRAFPAEAPSLILSATENLGTRLMGPVLSPGNRYRVVDCYNGVVAVEIERLGLPPMRGYCLAANLEAAEQSARPKRTSKQVDWLRSVSERVSQSLGVIDISISSAVSPSGASRHLPPLGGVLHD